jgi:hypothetical protein
VDPPPTMDQAPPRLSIVGGPKIYFTKNPEGTAGVLSRTIWHKILQPVAVYLRRVLINTLLIPPL